ncbi:MAG TPA: DUF6036 family nucleotidyltransferase [Candidatus Nanoarchaeia archaeon]|nr:DUF6036 family nucleotidyltransferase [Candidatus Nanoarchaeia archaeon]
MISNFKELERLFEEIDKSLSNRAHFFVIGGAMLLYHKLKMVTKDIDIVVDESKEFQEVELTLKTIGFSGKITENEYKNFCLSQIFIRDDFRIDLFHRIVCKGFVLSEAMQKRAHKILGLAHLTVSLCSEEDVFVFKNFTEREGDIEDCISLAKKGLKWEIILEEIKNQVRILGHDVWITWIGERLDILEERGLTIPIMKQVNELREEFFIKYEKRLG